MQTGADREEASKEKTSSENETCDRFKYKTIGSSFKYNTHNNSAA